MKRHLKSIAGVTLLEVMLVLAIAAMIIVMSVKYYQSATASQQTNSALQSIQAITAAADGIAQGDGTYTLVTSANVSAITGSNALYLPWAQSITIAPSATNYVVTLPATQGVICASLKYKLAANPHYNATANTCTTGTAAPFIYTYSP